MFSLHQSASLSQFRVVTPRTPPTLPATPFTPFPARVREAIEAAFLEHRGEEWCRFSTIGSAVRLYLAIAQEEALWRRHPDYQPGTVNIRGADLSVTLHMSEMSRKRALRLLVVAGVLEVRRRGGWREGLPTCLGSTYVLTAQYDARRRTTRTHMGPNHDRFLKYKYTDRRRAEAAPRLMSKLAYRLKEIDEADHLTERQRELLRGMAMRAADRPF